MLRSNDTAFSLALFGAAWVLLGCGPDAPPGDAGPGDAGPSTCDAVLELALGDPVGHPDPLGVGAGEARAGRITTPGVLPPFPSNLEVWESGDYLLANEHVAMTIEDAGASQLYDPWGGRPTGVARVEDGALVEVADFGEILLLVGRYTVMTTAVTVLADGSDGGPAVVRASGPLRPLPFFQEITRSIVPDEYDDLEGAIDYELAPGAHHVDVYVSILSRRTRQTRTPFGLHGFMFTERMPVFAPVAGFATNDMPDEIPYLAFVDPAAQSYLFESPSGPLTAGVNESGFVSRLGDGERYEPCAVTRVHRARLTFGHGLDAAMAARATDRGEPLVRISGVVRDAAGAPAADVLVHVTRGPADYVTRSRPTGADGAYEVHVPPGADVMLEPTRLGDARVAPVTQASLADATVDLALAPAGTISVRVLDELGEPIPARIQILPGPGAVVPAAPPGTHGAPRVGGGRAGIALSTDGTATLRAPVGQWRVVASHGYEYELAEAPASLLAEGATASVDLVLARAVETTGVMCADFHIHTRRSNDSGDDETYKVRGAVADGLEIPVRSEHEYVADFSDVIARLGMQDWAYGPGSIELTSMQIWGHMGVFPLEPDPGAINGGAPLWQRFPMPGTPDVPVETLEPPEVFDAVRARPEAPVVIINHPLGGTNYFGWVGYDPVTGMVDRPEGWDEEFGLVEIFNDADWVGARGGTVRHWLSFLDRGRRIFAVGSSDSHGLLSSPVGYPRTCLEVGTDDPRMLTPNVLRDALAAGHTTVSGGIYVDASVGTAGPGDEVGGLGVRTSVHVRVQAASWVDVDELVVVVDGEERETIPILPGDADPTNPAIRFEQDLDVDVASGADGSYVIVAAYGDSPLEPVHPGRIPFGVTNPIFLAP